MFKNKMLLILPPTLVGLLLVALALVLPAQASQAQSTAGQSSVAEPAQGLVEFEFPFHTAFGVLTSFPQGLVGAWVIDSTTYTATAHTHFEQWAGPFAVGICVVVKYDPKTLMANEIQTMHSQGCGGVGVDHLFGLIEQAPTVSGTLPLTNTWVISGVAFTSTPHTRLEAHHGPLVVGACAKVDYRTVNGLNLAQKIESEWAFLCTGPVAFNQIYGQIASFPPDLSGTWVLSTTGSVPFNFVTDPATRFDKEHQDFATGVCINVKYYTSDGVNHAVQVRITKDKLCQKVEAPALSKLVATIEVMPTGSYTGTWTLAGVAFTANEKTHFETYGAPLAAGDCVEAKYNASGGAMLLFQVEKETASQCLADNGSTRFKVFGVVETLPVSGTLTGTWQISGIAMDAISTTQFEQEHGVLALGAYVSAKFTYDAGSGSRTALEIETQVAPGYGCWHHFGRLEKYQPASSPDGYSLWIVDGITFLGDPGMERGLGLKVGSQVAVNAYQSGASLVATSVTAANNIFLPAVRR